MRKVSPDYARARHLIEESEKRKRFIETARNKIGISDDNANCFIENCYDTLIELVRARLLKDGFSSSGEGAHEAEVAYMRNIGFDEKDVRFLNEIRYFRNGITYYGKSFEKEQAEKATRFMAKIYATLKSKAENIK
ncbi:MAG: hypothetical protein KJ955_01925 [Nanoarchaeota archaeon]|nr:hypothetical protein [Nanoarchaeota archaeon]